MQQTHRTHLSEEPTIQAGHLVSRHSGVEERFALEDSFYNQMSNWNGETQGAVFVKSAVLIGGVPVEYRTAQMLANDGMFSQQLLDQAAPTNGWTGRKE